MGKASKPLGEFRVPQVLSLTTRSQLTILPNIFRGDQRSDLSVSVDEYSHLCAQYRTFSRLGAIRAKTAGCADVTRLGWSSHRPMKFHPKGPDAI